MSRKLKFIDWNPQKKRYDAIMAVGMILFLLVYGTATLWYNPDITTETLIIRASGLLALSMLHLILCIGPLSRFFPQAHILLYNRRHLGVSMFFVALVHAILSLITYYADSDSLALISLFTTPASYFSIVDFPFMVLGFLALLILGFMAATSHDYWLYRIGARRWKSLHSMVYVAYILIILHVLLGTFQNEGTVGMFLLLLTAAVIVCGLHLAAAWKNRNTEIHHIKRGSNDGYEYVCQISDIAPHYAQLFTFKGRSVAVFRSGEKIQAVDNYCPHQGGPLSEGKIINGCITCPWHGRQYQLKDGKAVPPCHKDIQVYPTQIRGDKVYVKI